MAESMTRLDFPVGTKVTLFGWSNPIDGEVDGYYRDLVMVELDNYMNTKNSKLWWRASRELDDEEISISKILVHPENLKRRFK